MRDDDRVPDRSPVRAREHRRDRIREERDRHQDEHPLRHLVRAAHEQQPHEHGRDGHGRLGRDVSEPERCADADELADADAEVRDQHGNRREGGQAHAVLLADQLREPLARHRSHPRRHLLDDDQREGDQHHHPEEVVAVAGADVGVRRDAARVVAGVRSDQAGAEDAEQRDEARRPTRTQRRRAAQQTPWRPSCQPDWGPHPCPASVLPQHAERPPPAARQQRARARRRR